MAKSQANNGMDLKGAYEALRLERDAQNSKVWKDVLGGKQSVPGITITKDHLMGIKIWEKVAKQATFAEFTLFVTKGEIPAVKLSQEEMEALKGGKAAAWKPSEILGILGGVCTVAGAVILIT